MASCAHPLPRPNTCTASPPPVPPAMAAPVPTQHRSDEGLAELIPWSWARQRPGTPHPPNFPAGLESAPRVCPLGARWDGARQRLPPPPPPPPPNGGECHLAQKAQETLGAGGAEEFFF